jgi:hypothetical protein
VISLPFCPFTSKNCFLAGERFLRKNLSPESPRILTPGWSNRAGCQASYFVIQGLKPILKTFLTLPDRSDAADPDVAVGYSPVKQFQIIFEWRYSPELPALWPFRALDIWHADKSVTFKPKLR